MLIANSVATKFSTPHPIGFVAGTDEGRKSLGVGHMVPILDILKRVLETGRGEGEDSAGSSLWDSSG